MKHFIMIFIFLDRGYTQLRANGPSRFFREAPRAQAPDLMPTMAESNSKPRAQVSVEPSARTLWSHKEFAQHVELMGTTKFTDLHQF